MIENIDGKSISLTNIMAIYPSQNDSYIVCGA